MGGISAARGELGRVRLLHLAVCPVADRLNEMLDVF